MQLFTATFVKCKFFTILLQQKLDLMIKVALKHLWKQDWESVFIKLHFNIDPMTIWVMGFTPSWLPHFTRKLRPILVSIGATRSLIPGDI